MTIFIVVSGGVAEVVEESVPSVAAIRKLPKSARLGVEIIDWDNLKADRTHTMNLLSREARRYVRAEERRQKGQRCG
ncbi:MAG TPA: hypothetical protein VGZ48_07355 [Candidatus Acidoferrales bacterium]|jgi:hypothetical protein|nr:hypothetical protein [Candidatus Acidoferrales bacterium]